MLAGSDLLAALNAWFIENNGFNEAVIDFAMSYRSHFEETAEGEHTHGAHEVHVEFKNQFEGAVVAFLAEHGATMETLADAVSEATADDGTTEAVAEMMM